MARESLEMQQFVRYQHHYLDTQVFQPAKTSIKTWTLLTF